MREKGGTVKREQKREQKKNGPFQPEFLLELYSEENDSMITYFFYNNRIYFKSSVHRVIKF